MRVAEQPAPVEEAKPQPQQPAQPQPTVPTVPAVPSVPAQLGRLSIRISSRVSRRRACVIMTGTARFAAGGADAAGGVNAGSILLVDSVNNRTNGSLNAGEATTALRSALAGNAIYPYGAQQLAVAKQQLGLSPQDSLGSRSKAMGIARNVGAQYVLLLQCHRQRQRA